MFSHEITNFSIKMEISTNDLKKSTISKEAMAAKKQRLHQLLNRKAFKELT